jgi:SAM-dependent methyltransferase
MTMESQKTSNLYIREQFIEFYEDRYGQNYMEEWPIERKRKIFEVIQELQLPSKGEALDFGCGNGVLTEVIRQALPFWKIYGTDISKTAIANAKIRYPHCTFFESSSLDFMHKKFDFVFTNHVFEHVLNLSEVIDQINEYLKTTSSMLHFLPCGNEGSLEYNVCLLRKDGINTERENRFFFEDQGHVRRLTTDQLYNLFQTKGFQLEKEYYANQYHGTIEEITNSNPKLVLLFSDTSQAVNEEARQTLLQLRIRLISITALRLPVQVVTNMLHKRNKSIKHYMLLLIGLPFYILSSPFDKYYKRKAREEWETKKHHRNGSEMALYFQRRGAIPDGPGILGCR